MPLWNNIHSGEEDRIFKHIIKYGLLLAGCWKGILYQDGTIDVKQHLCTVLN